MRKETIGGGGERERERGELGETYREIKKEREYKYRLEETERESEELRKRKIQRGENDRQSIRKKRNKK